MTVDFHGISSTQAHAVLQAMDAEAARRLLEHMVLSSDAPDPMLYTELAQRLLAESHETDRTSLFRLPTTAPSLAKAMLLVEYSPVFGEAHLETFSTFASVRSVLLGKVRSLLLTLGGTTSRSTVHVGGDLDRAFLARSVLHVWTCMWPWHRA